MGTTLPVCLIEEWQILAEFIVAIFWDWLVLVFSNGGRQMLQVFVQGAGRDWVFVLAVMKTGCLELGWVNMYS
jgi:hypothetical protein